MKIKFVLLTVAAVSMFGALASAPSAYAEGIGHFDCKGGDSYDVMKGMCIATVGATAYSPSMHMYKSYMKKHKMKMMKSQ